MCLYWYRGYQKKTMKFCSQGGMNNKRLEKTFDPALPITSCFFKKFGPTLLVLNPFTRFLKVFHYDELRHTNKCGHNSHGLIDTTELVAMLQVSCS